LNINKSSLILEEIMNIATIVVLLIIFATFALAIRHMLKNKDVCACGCSCEKCGKCSCSMHENIKEGI
jgi:hypothetical protein